MENVIPSSKKPTGERVVRLCLEDVFSIAVARKTLAEIEAKRRHEAILDQLRSFDIPTLRRLWDGFNDENSFCYGPEGEFDCADVHAILNEKGDGYYCAV